MTGIDQSVADRLVKVLADQGKTMAAAESLTGGLIGATVTATPGASRMFVGSAVTYSAEAKQSVLAVTADVIEQYTVVSQEVALQMAAGAGDVFGADFTVAVTGVAGPGPFEGIAAGTVCFAWQTPEGASSETRVFEGSRDSIRAQTVTAALQGVIDRAIPPQL